jgi:hypothetical protein
VQSNRHPDTVECLPIARGGVATGAYTGFFERSPAFCSNTSMSVPQQTQASPITSETDPYKNDRFNPVSPGKKEELDAEESAAGSSFSMDWAMLWYAS